MALGISAVLFLKTKTDFEGVNRFGTNDKDQEGCIQCNEPA